MLDEIHTGLRSLGIAAGIKVNEDVSGNAYIHGIVYNDGDTYENNEEVKIMWDLIAAECDKHEKHEISMEIQASLLVRETMFRSLILIAQDEKEKFDYYT